MSVINGCLDDCLLIVDAKKHVWHLPRGTWNVPLSVSVM